jgi:hypothetical protein
MVASSFLYLPSALYLIRYRESLSEGLYQLDFARPTRELLFAFLREEAIRSPRSGIGVKELRRIFSDAGCRLQSRGCGLRKTRLVWGCLLPVGEPGRRQGGIDQPHQQRKQQDIDNENGYHPKKHHRTCQLLPGPDGHIDCGRENPGKSTQRKKKHHHCDNQNWLGHIDRRDFSRRRRGAEIRSATIAVVQLKSRFGAAGWTKHELVNGRT